MSDVDEAPARRLWRRLELVHTVTYFAEPCRAATDALGCQGFWMGYFAARAAPMGPVPASVVEATFHGFHSSRVRRAIPDAWTRAAPEAFVTARAAAAASVLRSVHPGVEEGAGPIADTLQGIVDRADVGGRPLFAANREVILPDPVERLWQACTSLREHRGDGHVAALVAAGLDGCEANVLQAAVGTVPGELLRQSRQWPVEEWRAAGERLRGRRLVDATGSATPQGSRLRRGIEERTDALAGAPLEVLTSDEFDALLHSLDRLAGSVAAAGLVPFPNPIGLPERS